MAVAPTSGDLYSFGKEEALYCSDSRRKSNHDPIRFLYVRRSAIDILIPRTIRNISRNVIVTAAFKSQTRHDRLRAR